jgi:hypothetical protein
MTDIQPQFAGQAATLAGTLFHDVIRRPTFAESISSRRLRKVKRNFDPIAFFSLTRLPDPWYP